jgi:hypothetical protein
LANIRHANQAYRSENGIFAASSADLGSYFNSTLKGSYEFDPAIGDVTNVLTLSYDGVSGTRLYILSSNL